MYIQPQWLANNAIIQRDKALIISGKAQAEQEIGLWLDDALVDDVMSDEEGRFSLTLPAHAAGGPHILRVDSGEESNVYRNIMFGDVWLLGGQSNMQLWTRRLESRFGKEFEQASDSQVRYLRIEETQACDGPKSCLPRCQWVSVGKDDISHESGVGFFFAQYMRKASDVPLALIETAIGGTPVETWIDRGRLERLGYFPQWAEQYAQPGYAKASHEVYEKASRAWLALVDQYDAGLKEGWSSADCDDFTWNSSGLEALNWHNPEFADAGVVWVRTQVSIPQHAVGKRGMLHLGTLVDQDVVFVNGITVGETGYRYPPRDYGIDKLAETMTIAIRLCIDGERCGGFAEGKERTLSLVTDSGEEVLVDLNTVQWKYKRSVSVEPAPQQFFLYNVPSSCYNAMIAPLQGMSIAGIVYYQGETNATRTPEGYAAKMMLLVQSWREVFADPSCPFIEVQLPNIAFEADGWARLRDEQRRVLSMDHTAMVTCYDVGENNDLHPVDKKTIGYRAARAALAMKDVSGAEAMGPLVSHAELTDEGIQIFFTHVGQGLVAKAALSVEICRPEGWKRFDAAVSSSCSLYVALPADFHVKHGDLLRFLWSEAPEIALVNSEGLLASPFEIRVD